MGVSIRRVARLARVHVACAQCRGCERRADDCPWLETLLRMGFVCGDDRCAVGVGTRKSLTSRGFGFALRKLLTATALCAAVALFFRVRRRFARRAGCGSRPRRRAQVVEFAQHSRRARKGHLQPWRCAQLSGLVTCARGEPAREGGLRCDDRCHLVLARKAAPWSDQDDEVAVLSEDGVRGHEPERFGHGLRHQQPVERVAVVSRQRCDACRMHSGHR